MNAKRVKASEVQEAPEVKNVSYFTEELNIIEGSEEPFSHRMLSYITSLLKYTKQLENKLK